MFVRQVVIKPDGTPVVPKDLAVGSSVTLLGRTFHVVTADSETLAYLKDKYGVVTDRVARDYPPTYSHEAHRMGHDWQRQTKVRHGHCGCGCVFLHLSVS